MTGKMSAPLRLVFAGTPAFAATILEHLVDAHRVVAVYCQPARPTGRGRKLVRCATEIVAHRNDIEVRIPTSLRDEAPRLAALHPDALIVAAYGKLLPAQMLDIPRFGCINVHASLLPRWRGAAPIERAMLAGDSITGVCIMRMDAGLDTGPVLHRAECPILASDTGTSLHDRLAALGAQALLDTLERLPTLRAEPQSTFGASYATKLSASDSIIDWSNSAQRIANQIRALNARQPAVCIVAGERARLLFAEPIEAPAGAHAGRVISRDRRGVVVACGTGAVRITRAALSRGRGREMDIASLQNGYPSLFLPGQMLDAPH